MSEFDSKEFLALKTKWYKKLAKSGFSDAENSSGNLLQGSNPYAYRNRTLYGVKSTDVVAQFHETGINAVRDYFDLAGEFLRVHKFKNAKQKEMWRLHSEGLSAKEMAKLHPRQSGYKKTNVYDVIKTLRDEMLQLKWRKVADE